MWMLHRLATVTYSLWCVQFVVFFFFLNNDWLLSRYCAAPLECITRNVSHSHHIDIERRTTMTYSLLPDANILLFALCFPVFERGVSFASNHTIHTKKIAVVLVVVFFKFNAHRLLSLYLIHNNYFLNLYEVQYKLRTRKINKLYLSLDIKENYLYISFNICRFILLLFNYLTIW